MSAPIISGQLLYTDERFEGVGEIHSHVLARGQLPSLGEALCRGWTSSYQLVTGSVTERARVGLQACRVPVRSRPNLVLFRVYFLCRVSNSSTLTKYFVQLRHARCFGKLVTRSLHMNVCYTIDQRA